MKIPTVRLVFDRKKVATKTNKGLIQIEVLYNGKRKWMSTGIKVYKDQWDNRRWVVNTADMYDVNNNLREQVEGLEKWLRDSFSIKDVFTWDKLQSHLEDAQRSDNFIAFIEKAVDERNDIKGNTKSAHRTFCRILKEYGKICYFSDITKNNIMDFDNWLHGKKVKKIVNGIIKLEPMRQRSISQYQKIFCSYINIAIRKGYLESNPYSQFKVKRGESVPDRYLTDDELQKLEAAPLPKVKQDRARDIFVFQCCTGLSYADLCEFDFSKAKESGGDYLYSGKRKKTGEPYYFVILPKAMEILRKYNYNLPVTSIYNYDAVLKRVAASAGIEKPLASHWARRTAAMQFLNKGIRLEVVSKILGHSSVSTTEQFYASVTGETVFEEMKKAGV